MKCPRRKRVNYTYDSMVFQGNDGNFYKPVLTETTEDFLTCIGPECPAYEPALNYDKALNPELQPKDGCKMTRR